MFTPLFHITLPEDDGEDRHFAPILIALEAMCAVNEWHIRRANKRARQGLGLPIPPLYASGVRYAEDKHGREDWRDCYAVLKRGKGDCDQLVAWRIGELRAAGVRAEPAIKWQHLPREVMGMIGYPTRMIPAEGIHMVHCAVRYPSGQIEDPSKILGMGGAYTNRV